MVWLTNNYRYTTRCGYRLLLKCMKTYMRILSFNLMRIDADPDPDQQPWYEPLMLTSDSRFYLLKVTLAPFQDPKHLSVPRHFDEAE
jgi:hypothetical protein